MGFEQKPTKRIITPNNNDGTPHTEINFAYVTDPENPTERGHIVMGVISNGELIMTVDLGTPEEFRKRTGTPPLPGKEQQDDGT